MKDRAKIRQRAVLSKRKLRTVS